jgi:hypothetical protein
MNTLAQTILQRDAGASDTARLRDATVNTASPLTIDINGASAISANRLTSYTPTAADVVLVLQTEGRLIVLGKLA